jgi:predicted permease
VNDLGRDFREALLRLRRAPGLGAAAGLMLALGIGASTAMFSVVDAVLLRGLPFSAPERLLVMWERDLEGTHPLVEVSYPHFLDWRAGAASFEDLAVFGSNNWGLEARPREGGERYRITYSAVSASFFETLGAKPRLGRTFRAEDDEPGAGRVVVLSEGLWETRFGGDPGIVGRSIALGVAPPESYTVIGVMPKDFQFPRGAEAWAPAGREIAEVARKQSMSAEQLRGLGVFYVVGRRKPSATTAAVASEMDRLIGRLAREHGRPGKTAVAMISFMDHFYGRRTRPALVALGAAVGLVLLIACGNAAGIQLVGALQRQKDIAIRLALGASRWRIARQLLVESGVLAVAGGCLGIVFAAWGLETLLAWVPADIPRLEDAAVDRRVLLFTLGATVTTALLVALVPASRASSLRLAPSALELAGEPQRRHRWRVLITVAEVAMAVVVLVAAGLLSRSFLRLAAIDLGYHPENVLTFKVVPREDRYATIRDQHAFSRQILERLRGVPGVLAAGAVHLRPLEFGPIGSDSYVIVEGQPLDRDTVERNPWVNWEAATPGYFRAMGMRLLEGRDFDERDHEAAPPVVIVSESLARHFWSGERAVGKRLITWTGRRWEDIAAKPVWQTVVGVVEDARYRGLADLWLDLYLPYLQSPSPVGHLVVRTRADPLGLAGVIRSEIRALDPDQTVDGITSLEAIVSRALSPWRWNAVLSSAFGAIALILAASGIFGVVAYTVRGSTREIGIRMALGADSRGVIRMFLARAMKATLAGLALGVALASVLGRLLENLLFQVTASDPVTYAAMAGTVMAAALLAAYLPAGRAARVDPMVALRHE